MDPIAKRFMWDVISHLSTRRGKTAVILTTHSMNEAQALCTRIGIMVLLWTSLLNCMYCFSLVTAVIYPSFHLKVGGMLRCIGSAQHLKTRYGNHLQLEVLKNQNKFLSYFPMEEQLLVVIIHQKMSWYLNFTFVHYVWIGGRKREEKICSFLVWKSKEKGRELIFKSEPKTLKLQKTCMPLQKIDILKFQEPYWCEQVQ